MSHTTLSVMVKHRATHANKYFSCMSSYLDFDLEKGKNKLHIIQNLSRVFFTSLQELIESAPRVVDAVALDGDVVHQVPPLVLEQVFAAFQAVE